MSPVTEDIECLPGNEAEQWLAGQEPSCRTPLIDRNWLSAFAGDSISVVFLRFARRGNTVGAIGGLQVASSSNPILRAATERLFFFSGPLVVAPCPELMRDCFAALRGYAVRSQYVACTLRWYDFPFPFDFASTGFQPAFRHEFILDLRRSEAEVWGAIDRDQRRRIRRATERGLTFRENDRAGLGELLACASDTKNRKIQRGLQYNLYSIDFVNNEVLKQLLSSGICRTFGVYNDSRVLSSILVAIGPRRAYAMFIGTSAEGYKLGCNVFLYWELMRHLRSIGCTQLNLGAIPPDESGSGLARFKESLGAAKTPCAGAVCTDLQRGSWRDLAWRLCQRFR